MVEKIGAVNHSLPLLHKNTDHPAMVVAQRVDGNSGQHIQITPSVKVVNVRAGAVGYNKVGALVGRKQVLFLQRPNLAGCETKIGICHFTRSFRTSSQMTNDK